MNKMKIKRPVWYLLVPFLVHIGISYIVQMFFTAAFMGRMKFPENMTYGSEEMMQLVQQLYEKMTAYSTQITTVTGLLMIPVVVLLFRNDWRRRYAYGAVKREKVRGFEYLILLPLGVIACIVSNNIINMSEIAMYSESYREVNTSLYSASFPMMLVGLGLIVPVAEEFMFRGVLYNRIKDMTVQKKAWLLSALLFGFYHGNLVQGIYGFLAGMLLVYVYEKYGSMWAPVLLHMVLNITSVIMTKTGVLTWMFDDIIRVCVITVAGGMLLGFCLMYLVRMKDGTEKNTENEAQKEA